MNDLKVEFRTLTPIWTGGVTRDSDATRETGLLGSLRWWYEGIVRGLGGHVCDITGDDTEARCIWKQEQGGASRVTYDHLCPVCRLFGCTGWRRRFRLESEGLTPQPLFFVASNNVYQSAGNWLWRMFGGEDTGGTKSGRGSALAFTFGVEALWSERAQLRIVPLTGSTEDTIARVAFLLDVMARYGGLGAKTQLGFGQIEIIGNLDQQLVEVGQRLVQQDAASAPGPSDTKLFNLGSFFSRTYELTERELYRTIGREIGAPKPGFDYRQHYIPCAFDIRYKSQQKNPFTGQGQDFGMRPWFRERWGKSATHEIFGNSNARTDDQRSAGRIRVSHLYRLQPGGPWRVKIWGHVPPSVHSSEDRTRQGLTAVVQDIDAFIEGRGGMFPGSKLIAEYNREEVLGR